MENVISFWNENHPRQEEFKKLEKLIPPCGEANTLHGELIRAASRLYWDYCNNGNCNVIQTETETCSDCNGTGEVENMDWDEETNPNVDEFEYCYDCDGSGYVPVSEKIINPYYQDMIEFLYEHLKDTSSVHKLEEFLDKGKGYGLYEYNQEEMDVYDNLIVAVLDHAKTTKNEKREIIQ